MDVGRVKDMGVGASAGSTQKWMALSTKGWRCADVLSGVLLAAPLLAQTLTPPEPASRQDGIIYQQAEKAKAIHPPKPDKAELLIRDVAPDTPVAVA